MRIRISSAPSILAATAAVVAIAVSGCSAAEAFPTFSSNSRSSSAPATSSFDASAALSKLDTLPVKGRAPKTGYDRGQFGQAWTDDVTVEGGHNGCDARIICTQF